MKQLCGDICLSASVYLSGPRASADILPGLRIAIELFRNWPVLRLSRGRLDKHDALSAFFGLLTVFRGGLAVSIDSSGAGFGFVLGTRYGMVWYGTVTNNRKLYGGIFR